MRCCSHFYRDIVCCPFLLFVETPELLKFELIVKEQLTEVLPRLDSFSTFVPLS